MTGGTAALEQECVVFTRFLTRAVASEYVVRKYVDAHDLRRLAPAVPMDRVLVAVAGWSPAMTRVADAYARLVAPRSALRRKLIVLLAILETSPSFHRAIDGAPTRSFARTALELAAVGIAGTAASVAGLVIFAPIHLALRMRRRWS